MYVSAAFSVHLCLSCPLGTSSVAMASQWDVHKKRQDWSQSGWTDDSRWKEAKHYSSGIRATSSSHSDKLQELADAPQFGTSKKAN